MTEVVDRAQEGLLRNDRMLRDEGVGRSVRSGATPMVVRVNLALRRWATVLGVRDDRQLEDEAEDAVFPVDRRGAKVGDRHNSWHFCGTTLVNDVASGESGVIRLTEGLVEQSGSNFGEGSGGSASKKGYGRSGRGLDTARGHEELLLVQLRVRVALLVQLGEVLAGMSVGANSCSGGQA